MGDDLRRLRCGTPAPIPPVHSVLTGCIAQATYLSEARRDSSGFCWTALAFSLPKALFLWALIFTSMQGFVWLERALELYALVPIFFLLLVVGLCCGALPFSWELPCRGFLARLRGIRSSETDECAV